MAKKWIEPGSRIMDLAYIRDKKIVHTGEAVLIAVLARTRGKRSYEEVTKVANILNRNKRNRRK